MSNWPLVSAMAPVVAKSMESVPGLALAAATASRSEPSPLSSRLVTVKVLGSERSSRTSSRNRWVLVRSDRCRRCMPGAGPRATADRRLRSQLVNDMVRSPIQGWSANRMAGHRSRRADRAPGRCRAGGGLRRQAAVTAVRTPPAAFVGSPGLADAAPVARTALTRAERSGHVVIAGGRVVLGDSRQQVGAGDAARLEVQTATLTLAVAAPEARGAADREVVTDPGTQQGEGRVFVLEDPAPLAVRAVAARASRAADGEVGAHGAAADGEPR